MVKLILFAISLLLGRALGQERILFTQCQCQSNSFPVQSAGGLISGTLVSGSSNNICGDLDRNDFPLNSGVNLDAALSGLTLTSNFMNDGFAIGFRFSSAADSTFAFNPINAPFGNFNYVIRNDAFGFVNNVGTQNVVSADSTGEISVLVGIFESGDNNGNPNSLFICINKNGVSQCVTQADSPNIGNNVNIIIGANGVSAVRLLFAEFFDNVSSFEEEEDPSQLFNSIPQPTVIPGVNDNDFEIEEEAENAELDFTTLLRSSLAGLTFSVDLPLDPPALFDLTDVADGSVIVNPNDDFFGDISLTFAYGLSSINCFNQDISVTLEVTNVNDDPIVVAQDADAFAGVNNVYTDFRVASDVADVGQDQFISDDATFTQLNGQQVELRTADCSTVATSFSFSNGGISFCFIAPEDFISGSVTVTFEVEDDVGGTVQGSFDLNGRPPLAPLEFTNITGTENGAAINVPLGGIGESFDAIADDFTIDIKSIPDSSLGTLSVGVGGGLAQSGSIQFTPAAGVFNALNGASTGEDGLPIGSCASNERFNGFCPIAFTFTLRAGNFESEVGTFLFIINAVDDLGADLTFDAEVIPASALEGDDEVRVGLPAAVVTSDLGQSVFNVRLSITTSESVSVLLDSFVNDNRNINFLVTTGVNGDEVNNCVNFQCSRIDIETTPGQMTAILNTLEIVIDLNVNDVGRQLNFELQDGDSLIQNVPNEGEVEIDLEIQPLSFFDSPQNIAIVGGGGGGVLILILGLTVFRVRQRGNKMASNKIAMAQAKVDAEIARGKLREPEQKGKANNKASRREDDGVEKVGKNWEKHFDPDSQSHFYFNTKTEETQWDLPEELKGSRQHRIQTTELNI